ncbi:MAG: tryptophan synthase subunit alpha, partial [Phycisphaerales bacterium]|nr:tryptophan synthase subunit alpha [Phycisphaerales bacterium]
RAAGGGVALIGYVTAGFPSKDALAGQVRSMARHAAVIEIGVPFSDPMADGVTIQRSSKVALDNGVTLEWIFQTLEAMGPQACPIALMSYLNPVISAFGTGPRALAELARRARQAHVAALIVPDLPLDESAEVRAALHAQGVGLVQLVSPVTPRARAAELARASDGFVYAVTVTGVTGAAGATGGAAGGAADLHGYLSMVREVSPVPVCAGFGIRTRAQVAALAGVADGAIVGSALIDAIERGEDPGDVLATLGA